MKSNKGITLVSVVVYVLAITIIIGVISTITISFYNNTKSIQSNTDKGSYLTRLNHYMSSDINKYDTATISDSNKTLTLTNKDGDSVTYRMLGDGIYRNKVKICSEVQNTSNFTVDNVYDKSKVIIELKIGNTETMEKTIEYVLAK